MFEKVNPYHPDKIADRIAGAIVDLAYSREEDPKVAVEVLIGHELATVIIESSQRFTDAEVYRIVSRINGVPIALKLISVHQDFHLSSNQSGKIRCGDNGIFKGVPITKEQRQLTRIARKLSATYMGDGKYIIAHGGNKLIICQSNARESEIKSRVDMDKCELIINPLGYWTGGTTVDSGATNRKLGSDMGDSVTGGGLHGKDLSKADVSVNIYAFLKAQQIKSTVRLHCAIGDETVDGKPYSEIVEIARAYIKECGGFEKFAEWGLIK